MKDTVAASEISIAQGSQSFAAAAKLMSAGMRDDTVMLYAWCRHADDVIDGQDLGSRPDPGADAEARLSQLRADTLEALHGDLPMSPPFEALRAVARRHAFPDRWPLDLIEGFAMDVNARQYRTLSDTLEYSYHVAGVVGVMMARVMGVRDPAVLDRACDLGLAFQLTNIARDVMDDAAIGRCYLPQDWLNAADASIEGEIPSPAVYEVILRLLDAAEPYYGSARAGLPGLPLRCAWSIAAAARIYHAIGTRIRRGGPKAYRTRIRTSGAAKVGMVLRSGGDAFLSRASGKNVSREGLWNRPRADEKA
ncbi:phytoene/squalene synthase family protein (plasmid) [Paracoccus sp. TK19116]|uniref:Phytoene/squalene synthase family protein n=1 Tax=Paracoccus albicereus TaxID=2922394 RepID=A0ABT1MM75_9RHOB|nr:phytoene/squalene synthase family protein [Paracoccus albicereus]MCQ0969365.1 phytoene/squalene synthase family protein [Paracoccus albicereus]